MRNIKNIIVTVMLVLMMIALSSCSTYDNFIETFFTEKGVSSDTIKIGVLEPQTGNDSKYGEEEIKGIKLAYNQYDEVLGKKIELVYADTQNSIYVTESVVQDLIAKKPVIVLGTYGEASCLMASKYLGESKIPAITMTATNPLITANNEYYFRVCFSESSQGRALADYVFNSLREKKAAIVRTAGEDTSNDIVAKFSNRLEKLTEDESCITDTVQIDVNEKNYSKYVRELINSGTKTVFMPTSLNIAEKLFKELAAQNATGYTFIGTKDWHNDEKIIDLQSKYPGIKIAVASDFGTSNTSTVTNEEFVKAYKAEYDEEPSEEAALGYDAYMIAVKAIEESGSVDGYLLKEQLSQTKNFEGASGEISFDESGDPEKTINVDTIVNNQFYSVYTTDDVKEKGIVDKSKARKNFRLKKEVN